MPDVSRDDRIRDSIATIRDCDANGVGPGGLLFLDGQATLPPSVLDGS